MRFLKIVTDGRGLYAIRWGFLGYYKYFDLENPGYWWGVSSKYYTHCFAKKDLAETWYGILNPKVSCTILTTNEKQEFPDERNKV